MTGYKVNYVKFDKDFSNWERNGGKIRRSKLFTDKKKAEKFLAKKIRKYKKAASKQFNSADINPGNFKIKRVKVEKVLRELPTGRK